MKTLAEIIEELFQMLETLYVDGCLSDEERKQLDKLSDEYHIYHKGNLHDCEVGEI